MLLKTMASNRMKPTPYPIREKASINWHCQVQNLQVEFLPHRFVDVLATLSAKWSQFYTLQQLTTIFGIN